MRRLKDKEDGILGFDSIIRLHRRGKWMEDELLAMFTGRGHSFSRFYITSMGFCHFGYLFDSSFRKQST